MDGQSTLMAYYLYLYPDNWQEILRKAMFSSTLQKNHHLHLQPTLRFYTVSSIQAIKPNYCVPLCFPIYYLSSSFEDLLKKSTLEFNP